MTHQQLIDDLLDKINAHPENLHGIKVWQQAIDVILKEGSNG